MRVKARLETKRGNDLPSYPFRFISLAGGSAVRAVTRARMNVDGQPRTARLTVFCA